MIDLANIDIVLLVRKGSMKRDNVFENPKAAGAH
jgi:hypothetical protein